MQQRIEIQTVFGKLIAEQSGDPHYPGIHICLERNDGERQLVLVESTPGTPCESTHTLRALVWKNNFEEYSDVFTFYKWPEKGAEHV